MPKYEVDVGGKTYEVDAPDPNTAWQWANYTHIQTPPYLRLRVPLVRLSPPSKA